MFITQKADADGEEAPARFMAQDRQDGQGSLSHLHPRARAFTAQSVYLDLQLFMAGRSEQPLGFEIMGVLFFS